MLIENNATLDLDFNQYLITQKLRVEQFLEKIFKEYDSEQKNKSKHLFEAMRYAVFNGGKRLRPILVYATGSALGVPLSFLDAASAAVELIHCYSLVHDDLPAMDNDDLRRGKPTCHKAFDEATAILVGDALQTLAFEVLADNTLNPMAAGTQIQMIRALAEAAGMRGMVGGQSLDIIQSSKNMGNGEANNKGYSNRNGEGNRELEHLISIHRAKTGALICVCVKLAYLVSQEIDREQEKKKVFLRETCDDLFYDSLSENKIYISLQKYAENLGLAFQVQDDILDVIGEQHLTGKISGQDAKQKKLTFPALLGLNESKEFARLLHQQAMECLEDIPSQEGGLRLKALSEYFIQRIQ